MALALLVSTVLAPSSSAAAPAPETAVHPDRAAPRADLVFVKGTHVWTMDSWGGHRRQLTFSPFSDTSPAWSPDGERIAWARSRQDEAPGSLWVMNADGSGKRKILTGSTRNMRGGLTWSPDGKRIAFSMESALWSVGDDGTDLVKLSAPNSGGSWPDWSPDGKWIAYAQPDGGPTAIWLMRPDGSGSHRLYGSARGAFYPDWSPDGATIALSTDTVDGGLDGWYAVVVISRTGKYAYRVAAGYNPTWLDADNLVFEGHPYSPGHASFDYLFRRNVHGGRVVPYVRGHEEGSSDWQPDGRHSWISRAGSRY